MSLHRLNSDDSQLDESINGLNPAHQDSYRFIEGCGQYMTIKVMP
jgi:hypothetical protein